ncbi:MAG: PQQ-binding-like beta-propeller repeat protein, partial [Armatimonadota bacterium]
GEILAYYRDVLVLYEMHSTSKPGRDNQEQGTYHVLDADDGRMLWKRPHTRSDYHGVWDDPAYAGGLIWINEKSMGASGYRGFDPVTGELRRTFEGAPRAHCGRVVACENYILGTMSIFYSLETGKRLSPGFYKNGCRVGHLPANGLVYTFPISCSCIAYLRGHVAFAPAPTDSPDEPAVPTDPLEKGPAYGSIHERGGAQAEHEWTTYRRDIARSGATSAPLPGELKALWSTRVVSQQRTPHGRAITPPVVAEGKVFVAAPDSQQVSALDAETGELRWSYLVGGRVEAPPTIHRGLCLFGANDGWVYCLRASDGELVWRFRTSLAERRIVAYSRVESLWPVPGVLVNGDMAYFAGGRHGRTEDGVFVYGADPFTGGIAWKTHVDHNERETWYDNHVNDLLVGNDSAVFMGQLMFDLETGERSRTWYKDRSFGPKRWKHDYLVSGQGRDTTAVFPFGFLHDRQYGSQLERYQATHWAYRGIKGLILCYSSDTVFGVEATRSMGDSVLLFAKRPDASYAIGKETTLWTVQLRRGQVQGLLLSDRTLYTAGPAEHGGVLTSYSATDGRKVADVPFADVPVFDGMAAANGRLYVSTASGNVFCIGGA